MFLSSSLNIFKHGDTMSEKSNNELKSGRAKTQYIICPKCHKRIYKLVAYVKTYDVFENTQGKLRYKKLESWDLGNESIYEYKCPECGKVIATSQEEVEELFR